MRAAYKKKAHNELGSLNTGKGKMTAPPKKATLSYRGERQKQFKGREGMKNRKTLSRRKRSKFFRDLPGNNQKRKE